MSPYENHDHLSHGEEHHAFMSMGFAVVRQDPPNLNQTIEGRQSGIPNTDVDSAEVDSNDADVDGDEGVEDSQTMGEVIYHMHPRFGADFYLASSGAYGPALDCFSPEVTRDLSSGEDTMSESIIVHAPDSEPQSMQSSVFMEPLAGRADVDGGHHGGWILMDPPAENADSDALMEELVEAASGRAYCCRCQCGSPRYC